ncbi:MAG: hypothetical protein WEB00_07435 [Dehalococcoidia bacterium]
MGLALLVIGYLLAVPPLPFLRRIWRERLFQYALIESAGALLITLGWLSLDRTRAVIINGVWLVGWTVAWLAHRQRLL